MRVLQDMRYAIRFVAKTFRTECASTLVTLLTLALAIAANATIFSIANALLFKQTAGIVEPERLISLGWRNQRSEFSSISYPTYLDYKKRNDVFSGMAVSATGDANIGLRHGDIAQQVSALLVSEGLFEVTGTSPALGRFFAASDNRPGSQPAVVISHRLWKTQLAGDSGIVGKELVLNGHSVPVIGVAEEGFHGPDLREVDVFLPLVLRSVVRSASTEVDLMSERDAMWLTGIARLKPGVSFQSAAANIDVISAQIRQSDSGMNGGLGLYPYASIPSQRTTIQLFLTALMSIVGLVLLIACANVAGIGLARAAARKREIALRLAMGAGRGRIVTQLLTETLGLFTIAGAGGMLVAFWVTDLLYGLKGGLPIELAIDLSLDRRVALFTLAVTLVGALVSGLTPALSASQIDISTVLKEDPMTATIRKSRLRKALVVAQVSLSLVLLIAGALFVRTLMQTDLTNPGFDPVGVQVVSLDFFMAGYNEAQGKNFAGELLNRVRALPGVESASLAMDLPLDLNAFSFGPVSLERRQDSRPGGRTQANWNVVSPGFFETMRLPLLRGRDFTEADRGQGTNQVAIINQTMANQLWPGQDPIGKMFYARKGPREIEDANEVIGVATDTQNRVVGEAPQPFIYVSLNQTYISNHSLLIRTANGPDIVPVVRQALREIDPNLPIINARSMNQVIALSTLPQRVAAWIIGTMGLVGILLASIGIYGVTAHAVTSRTREIGIRIALGAKPQSVLRLVLRDGLMLSAVGLVLGLAGALIVGRLIRSYLYGIAPTDLIAFSGATFVLVGAALLANYLPARGATKVDPIVALRHE